MPKKINHDVAQINDPLASLDELRKRAAQAAVDYLQTCVKATDIIGIGTGATVEAFIHLLAAIDVPFSHCVASSLRSARALQQANLPQQTLAQCDAVDFYIDGIDEGMQNGITIKGGGGALAREKILATMAKTFITIADSQRLVKQVGQFPVPIEILPAAQAAVKKRLISSGGRPVLRQTKQGENFLTDNGHLIFDVAGLDLSDPATLESQLNAIPGVVENGIFCQRKADFMVFAHTKGAEWVDVNK